MVRQHLPGVRTGSQPVQVAQEITGSRVFVQASDQVGNRIDEMTVFGHRRIGQQADPGFFDGAAHVVGHALDHLEGHKISNPVAVRQLIGKGDIEEIMRGDPDPHGADVIRLESVGDHALPVGVHIELVVVGGERPSAERGFEPFHFHVGALDNAHFDRTAAGVHPALGPIGDLLQHAEGVRQIGLERHAGEEAPEFRLIQGALESRRRERQVPVSFHVQRDGFGGQRSVRPVVGLACSFAVENRQAFGNTVDGFRKGQGVDLGADGGDLDGDAFDARVPQVGEVGAHVGEGFLFAEDLLPQMIHVDPQTFVPVLLKVGTEQFVLPGDDDMPAVGAHFGDDAGHGVARNETADAQEQVNQQFFGKGEKTRDAVDRQQVVHLIRHPLRVSGAKALVDEGG